MRLLTTKDIPAWMALKNAAQWNQTEQDLQRLLTLQPDGCFGIDIDDKLAASATVVCYEPDLAWVGMVLTLPEYRGQGLARKLMEHAIDFAGSRTIRLDASDMGLHLYESLGFVAECPIERWTRPADAAQNHDREGVDKWFDPALDQEVFQADRTQLLEGFPRHAGVTNEAYAYTREGYGLDYFGPCVSNTPEAFDKLLSWSIRPDTPSCLDLFPYHDHAPRVASQHGFSPARTLTRMVKGTIKLPDPRYYTIAGFEFG